MHYHELKELTRRTDYSEGEEREELLRKLAKEMPEMNALEEVSNRTLIKALEISRGFELG